MIHSLSKLRIPTSGLFSTLVGCPPADARSVLPSRRPTMDGQNLRWRWYCGIFVDGSTHSSDIYFTNFLNDLRLAVLILNRVK